MTWEWKAGIRGFVYPLLFASIYKILHFINYDSVHLLVSSRIFYPDNFTSECHFVFLILLWLALQIWLPRVFQALLAAFADVKFFFLIRTLERREVATWTVRRGFVWGNKRGEVPDGRGHLMARCFFFFSSVVLLPSVLVVLVVLLHQDSDQQHGDHHHLPGSFLLPPPWVQNTQQVSTHLLSSLFSLLMNLIRKK